MNHLIRTNHRYHGWRESAKMVVGTKTVMQDLKRVWYNAKRAGYNFDNEVEQLLASLEASDDLNYTGLLNSTRSMISFLGKFAPELDVEGTRLHAGNNVISDAIVAANNGDTLLLYPGTYTQTVQMRIENKSLTFIPLGIVKIDCTDVPSASMEFRNSASIVQGSATKYIQIGTGAAGTGGLGNGVVVFGQANPNIYSSPNVVLNYVRVNNNSPSDTKAAIRVGSSRTIKYAKLECYNCSVADVGQDGFSCFGASNEAGGYTTMVCSSCTASGAGEDGFTAHEYSHMYTDNCEAYSCKTGFAPAFGCTWVSDSDSLHDNGINTYNPGDDRNTNLYLVGQPNFSATDLILGGVVGGTGHAYGNHIRISTVQKDAGPPVTYYGANTISFDNLTFAADAEALSWIAITGNVHSDPTQTVSFTNCDFTGIIYNNGLEDTATHDDTPIVLTFDTCTFNTSTTGWVVASRASKGTDWTFDTCTFTNTGTGNGVYCLGDITIGGSATTGCSITAVGTGVYGAGYSAGGSDYNTVTGSPDYDATATAGDHDINP